MDGSTKEGSTASNSPLPAAAGAFYHFDVAKVFLSKDAGEEGPVPSFEVIITIEYQPRIAALLSNILELYRWRNLSPERPNLD